MTAPTSRRAQARQPAGIPTGGRFASREHAETGLTLVDTSAVTASSDPEIEDVLDEWALVKAERERLDALASVGRPASANELMVLNNRMGDLLDRFAARSAALAGDVEPEPSQQSPSLPDWSDRIVGQVSDPDGSVAAAVAGGARYSFDPFVENGGVADQVVVLNRTGDGEELYGTVFHRRRDGVAPYWPYAMRFQANRPLSPDEMRHAAGLIGYAYRANVRGESLGEPVPDTPYSFTVSADSTKTARDDVGVAFAEFEDALPDLIASGSPVRKTDRSGPGTKGTKLIEGFDDPELRFEIFYDDVTS